jgi:hypothetical protein
MYLSRQSKFYRSASSFYSVFDFAHIIAGHPVEAVCLHTLLKLGRSTSPTRPIFRRKAEENFLRSQSFKIFIGVSFCMYLQAIRSSPETVFPGPRDTFQSRNRTYL